MKSIPEVLESFLDYQMVTRGAILIILLLYMPQGLIGVTKNILGRLRVRRST
jgi:ABC-type branched-subunit amino acid transport system permease subunit